MRVIDFGPGRSSGEAYDLSQCSDDIAIGDVLIVPDEKIVGILLGAWPVAVTHINGKFHTVKADLTFELILPTWSAKDNVDYSASLTEARRQADLRGWSRR